jgi:tripartite-type tricarboxylate transporter receptor subunit TctC
MSLAIREIIDISLELDDSKFSMRTPPGFKKDLQFQLEVLKEHDAAEGAGQIVRGVHMRLHAGSHIDAPEHNVRGGKQVQDLPLETFVGDAIVADLRHLVPGKAITADELERAVGAPIRRGDRLLLRTDVNKTYMSDDWMKRAPYLRSDGTRWCIDKGVVLVGYDFYHGVDEPGAPRVFNASRTLSEAGIVTLPYLNHLDRIGAQRVTLVALPLKLVGAEASPVRAVTLVVPLAPGTTSDILARLFAERLTGRFGQQFIVSNRPGAGGLIAAQAVANAPADGYTLLLANSGHAILGALNRNLPFDPIRDFAGVTMVAETPAIVAVPPSLGPRTLRDFIVLAKTAPGALNYASAGIGTATHLAGAYFARQAHVEMVHVPYKEGSALIADLVAGRVQVTFAPAAFMLPMLQEGKLLALAVSSGHPMQTPIAVPTARSSGIDYEYTTWYGILAPANTPGPVLQSLNAAVSAFSSDAELQRKISAQGIQARAVALRDFDSRIRRDMERLAPLLESLPDR